MSNGPFRPRSRSTDPHPHKGVGSPHPTPDPEERPQAAPPRPPQGRASQATWILGILIVVILAAITINTITTKKPGSRGVAAGAKLPPFAAPIATSNLVGDANIDTTGPKRACNFHDPRAVNSCDLAARGPVVLAFFAIASTRCEQQIDLLDRLRPRYPGYQFVAVSIRGSRDKLVDLVRRHGWKLPVAYDRDGAVANEYAVAVCPTITFARKGGRVVKTTLGSATEREIVRDLGTLR